MQNALFHVTEVNVSTGMTINIGNYESLRVDASVNIKRDAPVGEDASKEESIVADMYEKGWKIVQDQVRDKVIAVKGKKKKGEPEE